MFHFEKADEKAASNIRSVEKQETADIYLCSILQVLNICDQFPPKRVFRVNMKKMLSVLKNLEIRERNQYLAK